MSRARRRGVLVRTVALAACAAIAFGGCRRLFFAPARSRAWSRLEDRQAVFYRLAWGSTITSEAREQSRRRFDCVWDAMVDAGGDPRDDVECSVRQLDTNIECMRERRSAEECFTRAREVCSTTREYEAAAASCRTRLAPAPTSR